MLLIAVLKVLASEARQRRARRASHERDAMVPVDVVAKARLDRSLSNSGAYPFVV